MRRHPEAPKVPWWYHVLAILGGLVVGLIVVALLAWAVGW